MIVFVVATPLQLFNSSLILRHHFNGEKADLFVLDIACDMHEVINNYHAINIFESIYYIDDVCKKSSRMGILYDHVFTTRKQRRWLREVYHKKYSDMFTTLVGRTSTWIFSKLYNHNNDLKLHFYEEGLGVYMTSIYETYNGIKLMYSILGYKFEAAYVRDIYVYEPILCRVNNLKIPYKSIGKIVFDDERLISRTMGNSSFIPYDIEAIYFENAFEHTVFEGINENKIIDEICKVLGSNNLSIRLHPRSSINKYKNCGYRLDKNLGIPWENIIANSRNIDDIILITINSSAVFSPKLIYNKEPRIVVLALAISNEFKNENWASSFWQENFQEFVLSFKQLYSNKERIQIPSSFRELSEVLRNLTNN